MADKAVLTPQQCAAVNDSGGALLVSAAAGSGKTRVLVERLMRYMTEKNRPHRLDDFLVITYTNAAAAELRAKVRAAIGERLAKEPENGWLRRQADICHRAHIGTIHSFCIELLRENAHALGISPDFRVADEGESDLIRREVLESVLEDRFEKMASEGDFADLVDTMSAGRDDNRLKEIVLDVYSKLQSHPYPGRWIDNQLEMLRISEDRDAAETPWGKSLLESAMTAAGYWLNRLRKILDCGEEGFLSSYGSSISDSIDSAQRFAGSASWDEAFERSDIDFPRPKPVKGYPELKAERDRCKKELKKTAAVFDAPSGVLLRDMLAVAPTVRELFSLVSDFGVSYAEEKRRLGIIDFSDQEHMAVRLLIDEGTSEPTELANEVSMRFSEVLVDEYQDVNAVQELIFRAVSRGGKNIFMVGDVKQSIYRFRLADPSIFLEKYHTFADCGEAPEGEPRKVLLQSNFRSRRGVLEAVNFVFENVMSQHFGGMEYSEREKLYAGAVFPENSEPCVEYDILDMSGADEDEESPDKTEAEAEFIAKRIETLVSAMRLSDGKGGLRPAEYGDVAVLLRSVKGRAEIYARALLRRGIPASAGRADRFLDAPEISILLSILAVIDNPRQDVPLISAMRSPVWGFSSDELAGLRAADPKGDFYSSLFKAAPSNGKCRLFLEKIEAFRDCAPDLSAVDLIWRVCTETGMFAIAASMRRGEMSDANIMALIECAQRFESAGYRGIYQFLEYVRMLSERGEDVSPAALNENSGAVRIMSIHKSKGLEFPIVFLADLARSVNTTDSKQPLLVHPELGVGAKRTDLKNKAEYTTIARRAISQKLLDETYAEELRLLYVAMTRAQEKLVMVSAFADAGRELIKLRGETSAAPDPEVLRGMRRPCDWILTPALQRPEAAALFGSEKSEDKNSWDMRLVHISEKRLYENMGGGEAVCRVKPDEDIISAIERNLEFEYSFSEAENLPSKLTATELKSRAKDAEAAEEAAVLANIPSRRQKRIPDFSERQAMTAAERGNIMHLAMQHIDFSKCVSPEGIVSEIARLCDEKTITAGQASIIEPNAILRFFESEAGKIVLAADKLYREFKFSLLVPANRLTGGKCTDEVLLQGVVDCCAESGGQLVIIDYKTDFVTEESIERTAEEYRPQLDAYKLAMESVTGKKVVSRILWFFSAGKGVIIDLFPK